MPLKTSASLDYWGYYNGLPNKRFIADPSFLYYAGYLTQQHCPYEKFMDQTRGGERAMDKTKMLAYILKRVTYPTKGSTTFEYEPHSFSMYNYYPDTDKLLETERRIDLFGRNVSPPPAEYPTTYRFTLHRAVNIKFSSIINRGNQSFDFSVFEPSTVTIKKIKNGVTTTLKTWKLDASQRQQFTDLGYVTWEEFFFFDEYGPGVEYEVEAKLASGIPPQYLPTGTAYIGTSFKYYDVSPGAYTQSFGSGARIKSVKNYDEQGDLVSEKKYKYVQDNGTTTSGKLMTSVIFGNQNEMYFEESADGLRMMDFENVWFMSSESMVPYSSAAAGNPVGYSRVEETAVAKDGSGNGRKVYYYHNEQSEEGMNTPETPDLLNGSVLKEIVFNSANDTLVFTTYEYERTNVSYFTGVKAQCNFKLGYECNYFQVPDWTSCTYTYLFYPIRAERNFLKKKTTKEYAGSQYMKVIESFGYNSLGQLSSTTRDNSRAGQQTIYFRYPIDVLYPTAAEGELKVSGQHNTLIEQRTVVNAQDFSTTRFIYRKETAPNGEEQVVRDKIERSRDYNVDFDTEIEFERFGNNRSITQVKQNGVRTALIWNESNSSVIAEIANASADDVAFASFEAQESNVSNSNWLYDATGLNSTYARAGIKSLQLSVSTNLRRLALSSSKSYVVSYWSRNASPYSITGTIGTAATGLSVNGWTYFEHNVTGQVAITIVGTGYIDDVRLYPKGSLMTTYTFDPLKGISSKTDPANLTAYYNYDAFGRLQFIKDYKGNILKAFDYHYKQ